MLKRAAQQLARRRLIVAICSWWCTVAPVTSAQIRPPSLSEEDRQVIVQALRSVNVGLSDLLDATVFGCGKDTQRLCIGGATSGTACDGIDPVVRRWELAHDRCGDKQQTTR